MAVTCGAGKLNGGGPTSDACNMLIPSPREGGVAAYIQKDLGGTDQIRHLTKEV